VVAYFGLNPRMRQSGGQAAHLGRITKTGRAQLRDMLLEAGLVA
jgi:transposase